MAQQLVLARPARNPLRKSQSQSHRMHHVCGFARVGWQMANTVVMSCQNCSTSISFHLIFAIIKGKPTRDRVYTLARLNWFQVFAISGLLVNLPVSACAISMSSISPKNTNRLGAKYVCSGMSASIDSLSGFVFRIFHFFVVYSPFCWLFAFLLNEVHHHHRRRRELLLADAIKTKIGNDYRLHVLLQSVNESIRQLTPNCAIK